MHFPEGTLKQIYFDQLQASIGCPPWVIRRTLNVAGVTMVVLHAARSWKGLGAGVIASRGNKDAPLTPFGPSYWIETTIELEADVVSSMSGDEQQPMATPQRSNAYPLPITVIYPGGWFGMAGRKSAYAVITAAECPRPPPNLYAATLPAPVAYGADAEPIEDQAAEVGDWNSPDDSDVEELTRR